MTSKSLFLLLLICLCVVSVMADQAWAGKPTVIVYGTVLNTGEIISGSGFSIDSHSSEGSYGIRFTTAFTKEPTCVVTSGSGYYPTTSCGLIGSSPIGLNVLCSTVYIANPGSANETLDADRSDTIFTFICIQ